MNTKSMVRLIKNQAYNLYMTAAFGQSPKSRDLFIELDNPKVGDMVVEFTTMYRDDDDAEGIGRLVDVKGEGPDRIWTIRLEFSALPNREITWENAKFFKLKEDTI